MFLQIIKKKPARGPMDVAGQIFYLRTYPFQPIARNGRIRMKPRINPPKINIWNKPMRCPNKLDHELFGS